MKINPIILLVLKYGIAKGFPSQPRLTTWTVHVFRWWSHLHMRLCVLVYLRQKKLISRLRPKITKPMPRQIYYCIVVGHRRD